MLQAAGAITPISPWLWQGWFTALQVPHLVLDSSLHKLQPEGTYIFIRKGIEIAQREIK